MPTRGLTLGERAILKFVFGDTLIANTLITTNDANRGGEDNSITYADIPHYSKKIVPGFQRHNRGNLDLRPRIRACLAVQVRQAPDQRLARKRDETSGELRSKLLLRPDEIRRFL